MNRPVLVTHHSPDLDAIGSIWLFKRFDAQHYATAKVAFVNPGEKITDNEITQLESTSSHVTHVDTGLGEYDHHQPERGQLHICASSLVYDHLCQLHPDLAADQALKTLVEFITDIDHFGEINWPDSGNLRYSFMIHELISGKDNVDPHDDDSQMQFGLACLDGAYATLKEEVAAAEIIVSDGQPFDTKTGSCLAIATANGATVKRAQKQGIDLVIRKDPHLGNITIKAQPNSKFVLKELADKIKARDSVGTWFYHASGKMLLNGSKKHTSQIASPLSLEEIVKMVKEIF